MSFLSGFKSAITSDSSTAIKDAEATGSKLIADAKAEAVKLVADAKAGLTKVETVVVTEFDKIKSDLVYDADKAVANVKTEINSLKTYLSNQAAKIESQNKVIADAQAIITAVGAKAEAAKAVLEKLVSAVA